MCTGLSSSTGRCHKLWEPDIPDNRFGHSFCLFNEIAQNQETVFLALRYNPVKRQTHHNMGKNNIYVILVDDDPVMRRLLKKEIVNNFREGHIHVSTYASISELEAANYSKADIAVVDYNMGYNSVDFRNGLYVIDVIKKTNPETEVVLFTAEENTSLAVEAFAHGARDYVVKNSYMFHRLNVSLHQCLRLKAIKRRAEQHKRLGTVTLLVALAMLLAQTLANGFFPGWLRLW